MADFAAPQTVNSMLPTPDLNWATGAVVAIGAASAQSAAIQARVVLVCADQNCWVSIGANPTASIGAGSVFLAAGAFVTLPIQPGQRVAVVQQSVAGNLSVIPCVYPA